jgi:hypothetical protein
MLAHPGSILRRALLARSTTKRASASESISVRTASASPRETGRSRAISASSRRAEGSARTHSREISSGAPSEREVPIPRRIDGRLGADEREEREPTPERFPERGRPGEHLLRPLGAVRAEARHVLARPDEPLVVELDEVEAAGPSQRLDRLEPIRGGEPAQPGEPIALAQPLEHVPERCTSPVGVDLALEHGRRVDPQPTGDDLERARQGRVSHEQLAQHHELGDGPLLGRELARRKRGAASSIGGRPTAKAAASVAASTVPWSPVSAAAIASSIFVRAAGGSSESSSSFRSMEPEPT